MQLIADAIRATLLANGEWFAADDGAPLRRPLRDTFKVTDAVAEALRTYHSAPS